MTTDNSLYGALWLKSASAIDFENTNLREDTELFIDPTEILNLNVDLLNWIAQLVQNYFLELVTAVNQKDKDRCLYLLSSLNETWTASAFTHIGYSTGKKWKWIWEVKASNLCDSLFSNKAVQAWLLEGIDDATILISWIWKDNVSDLITNVIWDFLVRYSLESCINIWYKKRKLVKITVWDPDKKIWKKEVRDIPFVNNVPIILVPKIILKRYFICSIETFIRYWIVPVKQEKLLKENSSLCRKDKAWNLLPPPKKLIIDKMRTDWEYTKGYVNEFILNNPDVYRNFKKWLTS